MTHFGPYEKLGASYTKLLGQWLPRSGRRLRATPCFEVYLNSPESTAPGDLDHGYPCAVGTELKLQTNPEIGSTNMNTKLDLYKVQRRNT